MPSRDQIVPPDGGIRSPASESAGALARPGRLTLWPLDAGRYGLDCTFHGHWGCEDAEQHAAKLGRWGMPNAIRQESDGGWTVRLGPLHSLQVARALTYLVDDRVPTPGIGLREGPDPSRPSRRGQGSGGAVP